MATLTEFFQTEARDCLAQMDRGIERIPDPDLAALHRAARTLRGTAQMARDERIFRAASALEAASRGLAEHRLAWSDDVARRARDAIADLRVLMEQREDEAALDARVDASVARWHAAGVESAGRAALPTADADAAREFRAFAAREVAAIADALELGVQQLTASSMDREPLKMILRRQRALLGAARLDEIPVVAEILRAVEDLTRVIAKLDVRVKQEWLDIYRVAREGLRSAVTPLERDEDPAPSHSLSRLRHMRQELIERYGTGEAVSAAHETEGLVQARTATDATSAAVAAVGPIEPAHHDNHPPEPAESEAAVEPIAVEAATASEEAAGFAADEAVAAEPELLLGAEDMMAEPAGTAEPPVAAVDEEAVLLLTEEDVVEEPSAAAALAAEEDAVDIESLCYDREGALRRALELRDIIAPVAARDHAAREAVDEIFDLIAIALR